VIITRKVRLLPDENQERLLWEHAGVKRFAYNKYKSLSQKYYSVYGKTLSVVTMGKWFTRAKKSEKYSWLSDYNADVPKEAIRDFDKARKKSFDNFGNGFHTRFKSKHDLEQGFALDSRKCKVKKKCVNITRIGYVVTSKQLPRKKTLYNPRVKFDGQYWWLAVGINEPNIENELSNETVGVDVGIKDLMVASNGVYAININKVQKVKSLIRKKTKIQRQMSKRFRKGLKTQSNNYKMAKSKHLKLSRKLNNIRDNHIHQATNRLVKTKPAKIVVENMNVSFMLKNKKLSKAASYQKLNFLFKCIEYKCKRNGIEHVKASRNFASSQICHVCGYRYNNKDYEKQWGLHIRKWTCVSCETEHDRDMNAAINLSKWV